MYNRIYKTKLASAVLVLFPFVESTASWSRLVQLPRRKGRSVRYRMNAAAAESVQPDHLDLQDQMVRMVVTVSQGSLDQTVPMPRRGKDQLKETGASTALKAHLDHLDDQDPKDFVGLQETKALMDQWEHQDQWDHQDRWDQKDPVESQDQLASQEDLEFSVRFPDLQDQWDLQERWDLKVRKDPTAATAGQGGKVHVDHQAKTARMGRTEWTDPMASRERLDQKVPREAATTAHHQEPPLDIRMSFEIGSNFEAFVNFNSRTTRLLHRHCLQVFSKPLLLGTVADPDVFIESLSEVIPLLAMCSLFVSTCSFVSSTAL